MSFTWLPKGLSFHNRGYQWVASGKGQSLCHSNGNATENGAVCGSRYPMLSRYPVVEFSVHVCSVYGPLALATSPEVKKSQPNCCRWGTSWRKRSFWWRWEMKPLGLVEKGPRVNGEIEKQRFRAWGESNPYCWWYILVKHLAFYSLLKTLRASFLWHASRAWLGIQVRWSDNFAGTLADQLEPLGWTATTSGFQNEGQQCELGAPIETVDARLHDLRTSWRQLRFNQWLSKDRIDSTVATDNNLTISADRLEGLRKDLRGVSAHAMAVACGGMMTPALNFERLQACQPPIASCPYCGANEIPGCLHVLWECSAFDDLRSLPAPACPPAKRLGWNLQGFLDKTILNQMAEIRQREARWRMQALREQRRDQAA